MTDPFGPSPAGASLPPSSEPSDPEAAARRLLALAGPLPDRPRVLDLGPRPGRTALLLAAGAGAEVTAVDPHGPVLDALRETAASRGLGDRVRTVLAGPDGLAGPAFPDGAFDLVRDEDAPSGAGFGPAVRERLRLLAPGGALALSVRVRLGDGPSGAEPDGAPLTLPEAAGAAVAAGATVHAVRVRPEGGYGRAAYVLRAADPRWPVRPEAPADRAAVHALNAAAFPAPDEADLVDALREDPGAWVGLSRIAEAPDGTPAAYALLTRCRVGDVPALALAPVATSPRHQRQGAGQAAVRAVLDAARVRGEALVLVLGHPEYYPRFGFEPASRYGIRPGFEVPDEAMRALVLDGSVPVPAGVIHYPAAFGV